MLARNRLLARGPKQVIDFFDPLWLMRMRLRRFAYFHSATDGTQL
jgi:hypothetical protein